jgi:hypothetical protein
MFSLNGLALYRGDGSNGQLAMAYTNITSSGDSTLVAGVAGKQIIVFGYRIHTDTAMSILFKSSVAGAIGPTIPVQVGGYGNPFRIAEYMHTQPGEGLVLNLSANGNVSVELDYVAF